MVRGLKPWPIFAGMLVDAISTITLAVLYFLVIFGLQIVAGTPAADVSLPTVHLVVIELLGLFLVGLGGFVAARMARVLYTQHGTAVGIGALLLWLMVAWISPGENMALWYELVSLGALVPAGALGGYLAGRRRYRR